MICSNCQKNEASVFFKQLVNNQVSEAHLCLECAKAQDGGPASPASPVFDLLSALGGEQRAGAGRQAPCTGCGLRFSEFKKSGRLGCPACYESFKAPLKDILKRIHGATTHCGKMPPDAPEKLRQKELARLHDDLKRAVADESFEVAARLRDRIKVMEREG